MSAFDFDLMDFVENMEMLMVVMVCLGVIFLNVFLRYLKDSGNSSSGGSTAGDDTGVEETMCFLDDWDRDKQWEMEENMRLMEENLHFMEKQFFDDF